MEGQHRAQVLLQMCRDSDVQRCRDAGAGAELQRCTDGQVQICRCSDAEVQGSEI